MNLRLIEKMVMHGSLARGIKPTRTMLGKPHLVRDKATPADMAYTRSPEHLARLDQLIAAHAAKVE